MFRSSWLRLSIQRQRSKATCKASEAERRRERRFLTRQRLIESLEPRCLLAFDFGDAPDPAAGTGIGNYETLLVNNGPRHLIDVTQSTLFLGAAVDAEADASLNTSANGDDRFDPPGVDDEDGVIEPSPELQLTVGSIPKIRVRATNLTGAPATLFGWIDANRDGIFSDATDQASITIPSGSINETFIVIFPFLSLSAPLGKTFARFRLSTDAAASNPIGVAADGEVEDYPAFISTRGTGVVNPLKTKAISDGVNGGPPGSYFGSSLASIGDLNGDGIDDMTVGNGRGAIYVNYMNASGQITSFVRIGSGENGGPVLPLYDGFGSSVASIGDIDGDGVSDLVVGADQDQTGGAATGALYVLFMNTNGTVKQSKKIAHSTNGGPMLTSNARFGSSVSRIGDLDGDGIEDIAVGANYEIQGSRNTPPGALYILFLNTDGTVKSSSKIADGLNGGPSLSLDDRFGQSVASLGDIDGDGITDLAVGASYHGTSSQGAVYLLLMNRDGTAKSNVLLGDGLNGSSLLGNVSGLGNSLASIPDLDGDGIRELVAGGSLNDGSNSGQNVFVISLNANQQIKYSTRIGKSFNGGPFLRQQDFFGYAIASLGDLDGDGIGEIGVSSSTAPGVYSFLGTVFVLYMKPDNTPPTTMSFRRESPAQATTDANSLVFRAAFSEPVVNIDASDFVINSSTTGSISSITAATENSFNITISGGDLSSFNGTVGLNFAPNHNLQDKAGFLLPPVEPLIDQTFNVANYPIDFGDAPDSSIGTGQGNYQTTLSDDGPRHTIVPNLTIGSFVFGEPDALVVGSPFGSPDYDDALYDPNQDLLVTVGSVTHVRLKLFNNTGFAATLYGWIDFNRDGIFDNATERISVSVPNNTKTIIQQLTFPPIVANLASAGRSYARFRLSTDVAAANSYGLAFDGEVEDYPVTISLPSPGSLDSSKTVKIANAMNGGPVLVNNDTFGIAMASIGDLDGDGINDQVVGTEKDDTGGVLQSGAIYVQFMNADRTVRSDVKIARNLNGGPMLNASDYFGNSVASIGDVDGDGITELAVGVRGFDNGTLTNSGAVYILFLRANGTAKANMLITSGINGGRTLQAGDVFGQSVAALGDFNRDGIPDLAVGASSDDGSILNSNRGAVHLLYLNNDGSVKTSKKIDSALVTLQTGDEFGRSLSSLGDIDGDGITDLAVGAHLDDTGGTNRGTVYIVRLSDPLSSSSSGVVRSTTKIANATNGGPTLADSDFFGRSVSSLGDINGDGVNDLMVGAHQDDTGGNARGAAYVLLMNSNGTVAKSVKIAHALNGGPNLVDADAFGSAVALLGDLDGDGIVEIAVGANNDDTGGINRGSFYIFSLNVWTVQTSFTGSVDENVPSDTFVGSFATAPDALNTYAYTLTTGFGSTHNNRFLIDAAGMLKTISSINFEATPTLSIRVRTTRQDGFFFENSYTVVVNNVNERPTAFARGPYTIGEGISLTLNGTGTDPDAGTTLTYEWDFDYDALIFEVDSSSQTPSIVFPDGPASRTIALRVTDNGLPALTSIISTASVTITNISPVLTRTDATVRGSVMSLLANSGTWSDVIADTVTLAASLGTVIKNMDGTWSWSYMPTSRLSDQLVTISAMDEDGGNSQVTFLATADEVVNRQIFYNRSTSSVFGDGSGNPINAVDSSKLALLPGQPASFANYSNYVKGLNGLIIDMASMVGTPTAADFQFAVWNGSNAGGFVPLTEIPTVAVITGGGSREAARVKIEFDDNAIRNTWLRTTVLANANTGLSANDVFYFGHAMGDFNAGNIGTPIMVSSDLTDAIAVRQNLSLGVNSASVTNIYDVNKDGSVTLLDYGLVQQNANQRILSLFRAPVNLRISMPIGAIGMSAPMQGSLSISSSSRQTLDDGMVLSLLSPASIKNESPPETALARVMVELASDDEVSLDEPEMPLDEPESTTDSDVENDDQLASDFDEFFALPGTRF